MKKILALLITLFSLNSFSQAPTIDWQKCLGGTNDDYNSFLYQSDLIQQTTDGGFIICSSTKSNDGDVSGNHGGLDIWVVKYNASGNLVWQKCLGGTLDEKDNFYGPIPTIQQTTDGGFIICGLTQSNDGDVSGNHGGIDIWVVKLSSTGSLVWQKCLGGTSGDAATSIQQTTDGGFIICGWTLSNDGDVSGNHGNGDIWVVKLSSTGNLVWQKCLGGWNSDNAFSIQQTTDGGFIVCGSTYSNDGDVSGFHGGNGNDIWIVKLNASGNLVWQKCLGGSNSEGGEIQQTTNGDFIICGYTWSNDGDVVGKHGGSDIWMVKLNSSGDLVWQKCLGGTLNDGADFNLTGGVPIFQQTTDGGFIICGLTQSNDGDVDGNHGGEDIWVIKLNSSGNLVWQKCLGGTLTEYATSIQQTTDGGFIIGGYTWSNDGDVVGTHGGSDIWVVKLSSTGNLVWQKCLGGTLNEFATSIQTADGGYIVSGITESNDGDVSGNHGESDIWVVKLNATLSLVENEGNEKEFELYPNPTNGKVTLKVNDQFNPELVTVKNINSQIIETYSISKNTSNEYEIELNAVNGIYLIEVFDGENTITKKVIKN
jgi:hypothetical protein